MAEGNTRTLGKTGLNVSLLGFGAEALGRVNRTLDAASRTLNALLDMGITTIDTASAYGNSEAFIGQSIAHRKNEFTLITKCGYTNDYQPAWEPAQLAASIDESLRRVKTERLDVLLLHSCSLDALQRGDVIAAVQRARQQGKAAYIGYSGDNEALAFAINTGVFDVIECSFNMLDQANGPSIAQAQSRGMGVLAKRPIANAVPGRSEKPRSDYAAQYWPRWQAIGLSDADVDGLPWLEVATRFTGFWPGVSSILIGSSHADHMAANLEYLRKGPLPGRITNRLVEVFAAAGRNWPGLE